MRQRRQGREDAESEEAIEDPAWGKFPDILVGICVEEPKNHLESPSTVELDVCPDYNMYSEQSSQDRSMASIHRENKTLSNMHVRDR